MSLYEILDRFVATGVLACAGLVGAAMPPSQPLDGAAFSRRVRATGQNEAFGAALDALAHTLWQANERRGISLALAERHAGELTGLITAIRLTEQELGAALAAASAAPASRASARIAELVLGKSEASELLDRASLDREISQFMLEEMLVLVLERAPLVSALAPLLVEHRNALSIEQRGAARAGEGDAAGGPPADARVLPAPLAPAVSGNAAGGAVQAREELPEGALRRLKAILAQQPMSAVQRLARLDELGAWLISTITYLRKPTNEDGRLRQAKLDAADALERGDLELAMERLKTVREHMRDVRRRAEARIAEELQSLRQQMVEEAGATARLAELALARMDFALAADHFADAAGQLPAHEKGLELDYRQRQAEALAAIAETAGEPAAVDAAARAFRACRVLLTSTTDARARLRVLVGLGDMLVALAPREAQAITCLEEAISAYSDALLAVDKAAKPMQWALVQLSHAAALIERGNRTDRNGSWQAAAAALMPALEVFESRGADDLAEAARGKLRIIASAIDQAPAPTMIADHSRKVG